MIVLPPTFSKVHFHFLAAGLIVLMTFIAYANTFHVPFILDDYPNIKNNHYIQVSELSVASMSRAATQSPSNHRWLPNLSFALNYYLNGLDVRGFHLVNIFIHATCGIVVYFLCLITLATPSLKGYFRNTFEISLISALVWASHPVQTNAVTYIVQRMTGMAALFFILAVLCYALGRADNQLLGRKIAWFAATCLFGTCALFSKENAAILPLILISYELFFFKHTSTPYKLQKTTLAVAIGLLLLILFTFAFTNAAPIETILAGYKNRTFTPMERLLTESRILWVYVSLLLFPLPSRLNINYDFPLSSSILSPPSTLFAILGIVLMLAAILKLFHRHRLISFAIFWFLANLLIESTIIPLELVFEHRLYLPSVFFFIAIISYLSRLFENRPLPLRACACTLLFILTIFTLQRNNAWQNEVSLWQDVISKSPKLSRAYGYLAKAYIDEGHPEKGIKVFEEAHRNGLANTDLYVDWGKTAFENGKIDQAILYLTWAITLDPKNGEAHYNLGIIYGNKGMLDDAQREMTLGMQLKNEHKF